jgi:hypothetical protein
VVGGTAYAVGHHVATKNAEQQYTDEQQSQQIDDLQQQQAYQQQQQDYQQQQAYQQQAYQQPVYQQAPPPAAPAAPAGLSQDDIAQLKQLGQLHESGVLTDAEFEAAKQKILGI